MSAGKLLVSAATVYTGWLSVRPCPVVYLAFDSLGAPKSDAGKLAASSGGKSFDTDKSQRKDGGLHAYVKFGNVGLMPLDVREISLYRDKKSVNSFCGPSEKDGAKPTFVIHHRDDLFGSFAAPRYFQKETKTSLVQASPVKGVDDATWEAEFRDWASHYCIKVVYRILWLNWTERLPLVFKSTSQCPCCDWCRPHSDEDFIKKDAREVS
jgi:hypothetical protein